MDVDVDVEVVICAVLQTIVLVKALKPTNNNKN